MLRHFAVTLSVVLMTAFVTAARAEDLVPEYPLGSRAQSDLVSPVTFRVVNPDLTEALQREEAAKAPMVFRHIVTVADEAERDLRSQVAVARSEFLDRMRIALAGREPGAGDLGTLAYSAVLQEAMAARTEQIPLEQLAPLWLRGASDEPVVAPLLQPIRELMNLPIVDRATEAELSAGQPIRLFRVQGYQEIPSVQELLAIRPETVAAMLSNLETARSVVASYFSEDEAATAGFVASFLRPNCFPAPGLTEMVRVQLQAKALVYDTYVAGEPVLKQGQRIDRKTLAALAALRERQVMDALVTQVGTRTETVRPWDEKSLRLLAGAGAAAVLMILLLGWAGRSRAATTPEDTTLTVITTDAETVRWRQRALQAEQKVEQAHKAIRKRAIGWMREKLLGSVLQQRAELLNAQQMAALEMAALERRMTQLLVPLQERIRTYEKRIQELEGMLSQKEGEERRRLDARISRTRQQLELELERARAGAERGY